MNITFFNFEISISFKIPKIPKVTKINVIQEYKEYS